MARWSVRKINKWYDDQPYFLGTNFYPSDAINQLEMWQADTFNPKLIRRELKFGRKIGMNLHRVYLHDLLWEQDACGMLKRMDKFLSIADSLDAKIMFVFFDDCWRNDAKLGKQPKPKPYTHNSGWLQSPGKKVLNAPKQWGRLEKYITGVLEHFKDDPRIAMWDLYNEPGNDILGDNVVKEKTASKASLRLLKEVYDWANAVNPSQPKTSALWAPKSNQLQEINDFSLNNSDIITFHSYEPATIMQELVKELRRTRRPLICSEYLGRTAGSTFEHNLRFMVRENIGAINWGLVSGKSGTIYPWGWNKSKGEPPFYFHDVFQANGKLLYSHEQIVFDEILKLGITTK